jgi:hypothetical protein
MVQNGHLALKLDVKIKAYVTQKWAKSLLFATCFL